MKKYSLILAIACALAMSSCQRPVFHHEVYTVLDYVAASLDGKVLLTEASTVCFDYTPIASIAVREYDGHEIKQVSTETKVVTDFGDDFNSKPIAREKQIEHVSYGDFRHSTPQSVLEATAAAAYKMGGDAVFGIEIKATSRGYTAFGTVVKRK